MSKINLRIGFVPSYRFGYTGWCEQMRASSLAAFRGVEGMELVAPQPSPDGETVDGETGCVPYGAVQNLAQGEAVAEYFRRQKIDALILCPLDFGDERSATKIAEKLGVPVLLYATKEPPARQDAGLGRVSDSYCGNLSMASGLYRRKIPFRYAGLFFPDEHGLLCELQDFVRAAAVVKALRGAYLGQVGVRPPAFETVTYDETALIQKFSQTVIFAEVADIIARARKYSAGDSQVQAVIEEIRLSVPTITVGNDYLRDAASMELALAEFWTENRLSAMAIQCWPTIMREMNFNPCALFGRMTGRGMLTACETDIIGALSMLVNYQANLGEGLPHFVDWTIQHRQDPNRLLAWHCGNAPVALAGDPCTVALRSRRDMTGEEPVAEGEGSAGLYQFQVKSGQVTFCRLAEYDGQWKMLITTGEIIPSEETLAGTWAWVEVKDHARLYRTLIEEGFIHHASLIHGDQKNALLQACKFLDIQPVVVE
jgi:L-fucose isomerase-like protein